jgi:poly-gamma-glutamate capsule biosynthesis protein CapA/YwtB (metallophosphatase superfamily)
LVCSASIPDLSSGRVIPKKIPFAILVAILLIVAAVWQRVSVSNRSKPLVPLRGSSETLTIAATGDWLTHGPLPSVQAGSELARVADILKDASLGLTNLEENLLDQKNVPPPGMTGSPRWPYGTSVEAENLRRVGFTVISLANNHGTDYGIEGLKQTSNILDHEGLLHAGSGDDLLRAEAPVYVGTSPRRVAVIAVTTSAASESRATYAQGEILGRPGVNALRYVPDVTADPLTFATLQKSKIAAQPAPGDDRNQLNLSGTTIKRGPKTIVRFVPNERDIGDILAQIKLARSKSDVVIVMLHSHEPSNQSQTPAEFVQSFARATIDAGASLVVGNGPHQLRGIELYKGGAILYSLGNFTFDYNTIDPRAGDVYDAGIDLYGLALGAIENSKNNPVLPRLEEPVWWESVIAIATFDHGVLRSIRLQPVDLGVDLPMTQRGLPRLATPDRGIEILQRLAHLSPDLGTQIRVENGLGFFVRSSTQRRPTEDWIVGNWSEAAVETDVLAPTNRSFWACRRTLLGGLLSSTCIHCA